MSISKKISGGVLILIGAMASSCNNVPNSPGWEYMPDMYRSSSYETNSGNGIFADSLTDRQPVAGTISQGWVANSDFSVLKVPYPYKADSLGYELAGQNLKNPFPASPEVVGKGKIIFEKYCLHCHGPSGLGDGAVVTAGKFPPPPAYNGLLKNLPEGKMFHTLKYGKNMMGSHASQLTVEERWTVIRYVQTLQQIGGAPVAAAAPSDSASNASTAAVQGTAAKDSTAKK